VLEVRESNKGARALYEKVGFAAVHKRIGYYRECREDGLIMVLDLD
jgi:ribosomal protein S18 acetylase RimI-like enzyme